MEVHFSPETEQKLKDLAEQSGCETADQLVQDVVGEYIDSLAELRDMIDSRYDDMKSRKVMPVDGEQIFEELRVREDELLKKHSPQ